MAVFGGLMRMTGSLGRRQPAAERPRISESQEEHNIYCHPSH